MSTSNQIKRVDMTTLIPSSQTEAYEDMFKEITKKLYGEEASQSLHTPIAHITPDVERSFTNLVSAIYILYLFQ